MMKKQRLYGIFWEHPKKGWLGYVEHSFSMGWMKGRVNIWSHKHIEQAMRDAKNMNKKWNLQREGDRRGRIFVVRLTAENCPVSIDWKRWKKACKNWSGKNKFEWRNAIFEKL